ncbi:MAG: hypothetical protein NUV75_08240, partial [Gallionella sp.]|nr:hypothetical protein [Gallionella sp.]
EVYFRQIVEQCEGGKKKFGGITDIAELRTNFAESCIPQSMMSANVPDYDSFLEERRELMAAKLKTYFQAL